MTITRDQWMTREEWAIAKRTPYADSFDAVYVSDRAADYATPEEITAASEALRQLWCDLGRQATQVGVSPLARRQDEDVIDWMDRYDAAPAAEREQWDRLNVLQSRRRQVNTGRRSLAAGLVPKRSDLPHVELPAATETVIVRRDDAYRAARERRRQEIEAAPIDDEAWAKELRRRDNYYAHRAALETNHR